MRYSLSLAQRKIKDQDTDVQWGFTMKDGCTGILVNQPAQLCLENQVQLLILLSVLRQSFLLSAGGLGKGRMKGEATHSFIQQTLSTRYVPAIDLAAMALAVNRIVCKELSFCWMFKRHVLQSTQRGDWVEMGRERERERREGGREEGGVRENEEQERERFSKKNSGH